MNLLKKIRGLSRPVRQLGVLVIVFAAAMATAQGMDSEWTRWLSKHRWPSLVEFMGRSLFEAEGFGGGDPVVIYILAALGGYYLAWKRPEHRLHRLRPQFGFVVFSAAIWAFGLVHALKWSIGRARPPEVLRHGVPFSDWYALGPHFVTEGIYRGSFPSGHTAQAAVMFTLAYVLAGIGSDRPSLRLSAWVWAGLCLCYTSVMGIARCMSLSHWLTDVIAGLFLIWIGIHVSYHWILRVPEQTSFFRRTGRWPEGPAAWELRLSLWAVAALAGAAAAVLGARAWFLSDPAVLGLLLPAGAAAAVVSLYRAGLLRRRALGEMDRPPT